MDQNQRFEYLFQKGLDMESQMEKIIEDAQPKPKPEIKIKYAKPIIITRDLLTGTPEYQAQKQLSDLELEQEIHNTIKQAIRAADNKPPEKYTNAVTEEMINDYRKEVIKPIDIKGKKFLYRSVEVPPIANPIDTPFTGIERTEAEAQDAVGDLVDEIGELEDDYDDYVEIKRKLEEAYNTSTTAPAYDEAAKRAEYTAKTNAELINLINFNGYPMPKAKNKAGYVDRIVENEMRVTGRSPINIKAQIDQTELEIQQIVTDIRKAKGKIRQIQSNYTLQLQVDEENRLKKIEYENLQRQQNEGLLNDFNRLNKGRTQLARQQDESEDDFYLRLVAMGNVEADPVAIEKQIQTDILIKAKKNMLELTNDLSIAETAVKFLTNDERFQMNKFFPKIKKNYSETFGLNNKDMDANEISEFIQNQIVSGQALITEKEPPPSPPPQQGTKPDIDVQVRQFSLKQFEQIIDELNDQNPALNLLKGSRKDMVQQLNDANVYNPVNFRLILKIPDAPVIDFPLVPTTRPIIPDEEFTPEEEALSAIGSGLKNQVLPQTVIFGKIALDLNKLYYQNVLSIKRHNGNKIIGHKNRRVSDNFVDIIFKMFNNKAITQSDLKNIKDELQIYDNLVVQSGLHKSNLIPTTIEQTSEQMKKRLGLLTGEIEAGNSNKSLLTELHELLFKMVRIHLISKSAATKYYNNLKDQFFTI